MLTESRGWILDNQIFKKKILSHVIQRLGTPLLLPGGGDICPHCKTDLKTAMQHNGKIPNRYSVSISVCLSFQFKEESLYLWKGQLGAHFLHYFQRSNTCLPDSLYSTPSSGEKGDFYDNLSDEWTVFGSSEQQLYIWFCVLMGWIGLHPDLIFHSTQQVHFCDCLEQNSSISQEIRIYNVALQ